MSHKHPSIKSGKAFKHARHKVSPPGIIPGQSGVGHRPYASRKQWRYFFANPKLRRYAIGKAHATGGHSAITHRLHFSPAYRALPVYSPHVLSAKDKAKHAAVVANRHR
jgi:hypothetical protein